MILLFYILDKEVINICSREKPWPPCPLGSTPVWGCIVEYMIFQSEQNRDKIKSSYKFEFDVLVEYFPHFEVFFFSKTRHGKNFYFFFKFTNKIIEYSPRAHTRFFCGPQTFQQTHANVRCVSIFFGTFILSHVLFYKKARMKKARTKIAPRMI